MIIRKKLQHYKENPQQTEEANHRMRKHLQAMQLIVNFSGSVKSIRKQQ